MMGVRFHAQCEVSILVDLDAEPMEANDLAPVNLYSLCKELIRRKLPLELCCVEGPIMIIPRQLVLCSLVGTGLFVIISSIQDIITHHG